MHNPAHAYGARIMLHCLQVLGAVATLAALNAGISTAASAAGAPIPEPPAGQERVWSKGSWHLFASRGKYNKQCSLFLSAAEVSANAGTTAIAIKSTRNADAGTLVLTVENEGASAQMTLLSRNKRLGIKRLERVKFREFKSLPMVEKLRDEKPFYITWQDKDRNYHSARFEPQEFKNVAAEVLSNCLVVIDNDQKLEQQLLSMGKKGCNELHGKLLRDVQRNDASYKCVVCQTMCKPIPDTAQRSKDWLFVKSDDSCEVSTYAKSVVGDIRQRLAPQVLFRKYRSSDGDTLMFRMTKSELFDTTSNVYLQTDDNDWFDLQFEGGAVKPRATGAASVSSEVTKALAGKVRTFEINGTSKHGGNLKIHFSASGFSAAFKKMASTCGAKAILSWIDRYHSMTWKVSSEYRYSVKLAFYTQPPTRAWPGGNRSYVLADSDTHDFVLRCRWGEKICYGAWSGRTYWGCGRGCRQRCSTCCGICKGGEIRKNLSD